jgi:hypothetical protein|tara:strand:- start:1609 stop:1794 length:186 start_codon:yes stop_codon:yes gene_type:complete
MIDHKSADNIQPHQLVIDNTGDTTKIGVVLAAEEDGRCQVWWAWTDDWSFSMEDKANLARF